MCRQIGGWQLVRQAHLKPAVLCHAPSRRDLLFRIVDTVFQVNAELVD